ncbi:MAG: acyltransferase family protein [Holosporaceae bacterium]|jgi:peptidoglycan/LPS O-acetylase OafA/YrhL|nr:acyltransferase family protein [Holosporaceae bacterium]
MNNKVNFFDDIERLRGFACMLVYIQHFALVCPLRFIYNILPTHLLMGEGGMRIFFAISGFVVTLSLIKKLESVSGEQFIDRLHSARPILFSFYKNHFFRIYPVVFVMLLIMLLFLSLTENNRDFLWPLLRCPIDVFFGIQNYSI